MPRRRYKVGREVQPDPVYHSKLVTRFINGIMRKGKKSLAERIFYQAMEVIQQKTGTPPLDIFKKAIENVRPQLSVKPRRVGGATYQVPVEVPKKRGISIAIRWIISYAKENKGKPMYERLASELLDASRNTGASVKKKSDTHKMAEANKAFIHYRW
ncbi:MAG: 30S ribosomal protein S7 [bacterium]|nr:30S ribosomal protein S7 [bacterium]